MSNLPGDIHILSGAESMRLRSFCTTATYTAADLDDYSQLLRNGPFQAVTDDFSRRVADVGLEQARKALADITYGPTKVTFYNYILQLTLLAPHSRSLYISCIRFFALEARVPVDSVDLSGSTTLMWSISTKPYFDPEVAAILLSAGADINHRNRYGCVAAHDIAMASDFSAAGKQKTVDAMRYFLVHGGDVNIADGDGVTAAALASRVVGLLPELGMLMLGAGNGAGSAGAGDGGSGGSGSGNMAGGQTMTANGKGKKVGRNEPCSCGSKKKYKVCCGRN